KPNRMRLALRLADGMDAAWTATERHELQADQIGWETVPVKLPPAPHLIKEELIQALKTEPPKGYIAKADQLAWIIRCEAGHEIDIACLRVGNARVVHMPGELFVEYQLAAKQLRPDLHVSMAAYGEYGPGYIGTEIAYSQGGYETSERASNVAPHTETILMGAVKKLLQSDASAN
ncbi:MAG: hypothetical protein KDA66_02100, partial [Planctomycetaceae bacterium]|nr:hypothetical protein [Planctomycetaceae bacterium]